MKSLLTSGDALNELCGSSAIELDPALVIYSSTGGVSELDPGLLAWFSPVEFPELPERRYFVDLWCVSVNTSFHVAVTRAGSNGGDAGSYATMLLCMVSLRTGLPFPAFRNTWGPPPVANGVAAAPFPPVGKKCWYPHGQVM